MAEQDSLPRRFSASTTVNPSAVSSPRRCNFSTKNSWQRVRAAARTRCKPQRSERLNCYGLSSRGSQVGYIYLGSRCIATDSACGFKPDITCLLRAKSNGFERPVGRPGAARDLCKSRPISADINSIVSNGSGRIGVETRLVGQPGYAVDAPKIKCD